MAIVLGNTTRRQKGINKNKIGFADAEQRFTFELIDERVNRLAYGLLNLGLKKGQKVAVIGHPFFGAFFED
jgi:non-ribosomal peptide synthetase component E (peptide arylation enzyme)